MKGRGRREKGEGESNSLRCRQAIGRVGGLMSFIVIRIVVLLYYCVLCMIHTFFTPTTREHEVFSVGASMIWIDWIEEGCVGLIINQPLEKVTLEGQTSLLEKS